MADLPAMIIDSFAGGGGASTGIEMALGRSPDVAINHNAKALALHAANHPDTLHLDSNIWDVKPTEVTRGRKVGLLWASPDCKHFSKAKGGAPRDRNIRDLAWVVVDWAEQVKPDVIAMENVEEFVTWGPLGNDGQPLKEFMGQTFELWVARLKKAGYKVQWRELRACDYGAPTIRKRWFLIARRDGRPIVWPKPTHGDPDSPAVRRGKLKPWRTAAECIDWSIPCPSIFASAAEIMAQHGIRAIRPLAENTLSRIARGMKRYVIEADRPFLVNLTHGAREEDAGQPFRTITGAHRGEKALVAPSLLRTDMTSAVKRNGIYALQDPLRTQMTAGSFALLSPSLLSLKGTTRRDFAADTPHPTVLAGGGHSVLIAPVLTFAQQGGRNRSVEDPHHTICASRKDQNSILTPYLASIAHGYSGGRREYPLTDPIGTVTVGGIQHALIAPTLVQTGYGERDGQAPRALDIGKPLGTVVAGGTKHAAVAAFLAQQNNDSRRDGGVNPGRPADEPISTLTSSGSHQTPVTAFFAKYYGAGTGARMDEPCHTVTVNDRFGHVQAELQAPPFGPEHEYAAYRVARFLEAWGAWDSRRFVTLTIGGAEYVVVDIGMRMLTPRELFTAQGFPRDYVIEGVWEPLDSEDPVFKPFAKDVQISCCGNSVCPDLARAIIAANCGHLAASTSEMEKMDA